MRLVALDGFDEATRRHRWAGNVLPVPYQGARTCARCGYGTLITVPSWTEDALFFGGGYGESTRLTAGVCAACGRTSVITRESVRPPRRTRR